jgi:hypothetical protein
MNSFIKDMLSSGDNISSKRVMGMISIIIYYMIYASTYWVDLTEIQVNMADNILYFGGLMLGLGLIDKMRKL